MIAKNKYSPAVFYVRDLIKEEKSISALAKNSGLNRNSLFRLLHEQQYCLSNKNFSKLIGYWCQQQFNGACPSISLNVQEACK